MFFYSMFNLFQEYLEYISRFSEVEYTYKTYTLKSEMSDFLMEIQRVEMFMCQVLEVFYSI